MGTRGFWARYGVLVRNGTGLLAGALALWEGPGRGSGFTPRLPGQVCNDVDECNDGNNGGCDPNSVCTNTVVSRVPGVCPESAACGHTHTRTRHCRAPAAPPSSPGQATLMWLTLAPNPGSASYGGW